MSLKDNPKLTFSSLLKSSFFESTNSLRLSKNELYIILGSHGYYYFIGRFLIFNFSCLTEPEGVRK
jgi:hypothetical protein